ncbi:CopG family transcriptional regulator [bacterium]
MKKKIRYTNEPMGDLKIVSDFLPSPEELAYKEETVKVTISLSKSSIEYFKELAVQYRTPYQQMIRKLLDEYTRRQKVRS